MARPRKGDELNIDHLLDPDPDYYSYRPPTPSSSLCSVSVVRGAGQRLSMIQRRDEQRAWAELEDHAGMRLAKGTL